MIRPENPCICKPPKRKAGCHAECEEYKEYIKQLNEFNAIVKTNKDIYYASEGMSITTTYRNRYARKRK